MAGPDDRADGSRLIEGLAAFPRSTSVARLPLEVSACQIYSHCKAKHMGVSVLGAYACARRTNRDHEFDFVLEAGGCEGVFDDASGQDDGVGRLLEKKGRLTFVATHFAHVRCVISSDAIDPSDGKELPIIHDRHTCKRGRR